MPLKTIMNSTVAALALSSSLALAQEAPDKAASAPEPAASAASAPESAKAKCEFSLKSVAGAILGSAVAKHAGNKGSSIGIDGLGKPSGKGVQGVISPECTRP